MPILLIYITGIQARRKLPNGRFSPWTERVYLTWTHVQAVGLLNSKWAANTNVGRYDLRYIGKLISII